MKRSVSTRTLATVPLVPVGSGGVWVGAEGCGQRRVDVDVCVGKVCVDGSTYDFGQRKAFGLGDLVDAATLVFGEVHLRARGWHTAQHTAPECDASHADSTGWGSRSSWVTSGTGTVQTAALSRGRLPSAAGPPACGFGRLSPTAPRPAITNASSEQIQQDRARRGDRDRQPEHRDSCSELQGRSWLLLSEADQQ